VIFDKVLQNEIVEVDGEKWEKTGTPTGCEVGKYQVITDGKTTSIVIAFADTAEHMVNISADIK
jgi:hypothetical protein